MKRSSESESVSDADGRNSPWRLSDFQGITAAQLNESIAKVFGFNDLRNLFARCHRIFPKLTIEALQTQILEKPENVFCINKKDMKIIIDSRNMVLESAIIYKEELTLLLITYTLINR